MLKFINGSAGTGKTQYMREIILSKAKNKDKKLILIVPEQATFENERQILSLMGAKLMNSIRILSFTRLAAFVFDKLGGLSKDRLNEAGRNVLMNLSLWEVQDKLEIFKSQIDKIEITELLLTALSEFKKCNVSYDDLLKYSSLLEDKDLSQKLKEISIIIESFESMVEEKYMDPLDDLTRLSDKLKEVDFFKGYTVFIDSFSSFSLQEIEVLKLIVKQAKNVYISLCIDSKDNISEYSLFSQVSKTMNTLTRLVKDEGVEASIEKSLEIPYRFKKDELKFLSENLYREKSSTWNNELHNVSLYNAANQYDESQFVSRSIKKLVFEEGYRYKDILVITRNIEAYRSIIDITFDDYEIPYFIDIKEKIDARPLMNTVLTAFDIIIKKYKSDDIFKYLKNGLAGLSIEEIGLLENYVLMWKIDKDEWLSEFVKHPRGYRENTTNDDKVLLKRINKLRVRVIKPLLDFSNKIKDASGLEIAKETYKFLRIIGADKSLKNISVELEADGKISLAKEELRLWDILMENLNQIAIATDGRNVDERKFSKLLKLAIASSNMSSIPATLDQVQIGVAGRSYASEPKVVFIIGANEGDFPKVSGETGIFSMTQRKKLIASGLEIYDHLEKTVMDEIFIAYTTLSTVSEQLYISFLSADVQASAKSPSSIVRQVRKIFPKIEILDEYCFDEGDLIWAVRPTFELMAKLWRTDSGALKELRNYFLSREDYAEPLKKINIAADKPCFKFEDKQNSEKFFGSRLKLSASQIEKYYLCKFQYFCQYGLNVKKRKLAEIDALEYGSLMHYIFENMLKIYNIEDLSKLDDEEIRIKVEEYLNKYVEQKLGGWEDKTARFKFQFKRLVNTASILIRHMMIELSQSEFEPCEFELSIESEGDICPLIFNLPDGEEVIVGGKVDRLDLMKKNGLSYVRIVDYKTGVKEFKLSDVLYGINIQMLLYMDAILKNGQNKYGNLTPAGILYMPANQPVVSAGRQESTEKIKKMKMKKMRMNGLILDDQLVVSGMESSGKGIFIPAMIKNEEVSKSESVANLALFRALLKKVESLIIDMAEGLKDGNIEAVPKKGEYDACKWCDYNSICGFEEGEAGIMVERLKKSEVKKILCTDEFGDDDGDS